MSGGARALVAELLGTALLLLAVVGSGIVASSADTAVGALFPHAVVVGLALAVIVRLLQPVSGAHLNPVVTLVDAALGGLARRAVPGYLAAQLGGAVLGVVGANLLFGLPAATVGTTDRGAATLVASEVVATFGLVLLILGLVRQGAVRTVGPAVGAYVAAAIVLTPSTSFANPAVTVGRVLTDTYTGIAPDGVPPFVAAQLAGGAAAAALARWLFAVPAPPAQPRSAP